MKLLSLKYHDITESDWDFSELKLQRVNLFVGATGSGKTRMLNIIFNVAKHITGGTITGPGDWTMILSHENKTYRWHCRAESLHPTQTTVTAESITVSAQDENEAVLVARDKDTFKFKDAILPKLSKTSSAISILKEEPDISPLFNGFNHIARRNFFSDELERAAAFASVSPDLLERVEKNKSLETLWTIDAPLNVRLFVLKEKFHKIYEDICARYKAVLSSNTFV